MKSLPNTIAVLTLTLSLALTSCETAGVSSITGLASGAIARSAGVSGTEAALIGVAAGVATAVIINYSKRKASEREQAAAASRAAQIQKKVDTKSKSAPKTRYVAVPAAKSDTVMLYDTKKEKVVGSTAYDMEKTPKRGEVVKFGSINAEYVGT